MAHGSSFSAPFLFLPLLVLVLFISSTAAMYGDRPGQLRKSAFSSYAYNGYLHTNDLEMWSKEDIRRKSQDEPYTLVQIGSREAHSLHTTDVNKKKKDKLLSRSASLSRSRSRSKSVKSPSAVALSTKDKLREYVKDPSRTTWDLMRILRFSFHGMKLAEEELPPAGLWTAKSRPVSLLPEKRHERRVKRRAKKAALKKAAKAERVKAGLPESPPEIEVEKLLKKLHRRR